MSGIVVMNFLFACQQIINTVIVVIYVLVDLQESVVRSGSNARELQSCACQYYQKAIAHITNKAVGQDSWRCNDSNVSSVVLKF